MLLYQIIENYLYSDSQVSKYVNISEGLLIDIKNHQNFLYKL